ncbi:glycosyl hydrolase family 43 [Novosphingobium sp. PhB55]|uniref:family 43 glycosylhydrolase n=1 Tax=Novosphingobium sp. PhB55 TaxID=2485106 RepID=UPI0010D381E1|nr:family 43 glycosylhydrolase [Novosphingobium sp. PhB55]TDW61948.1 glycosyl hydrolase family 43 [Novosphingobium sp. PhB55]
MQSSRRGTGRRPALPFGRGAASVRTQACAWAAILGIGLSPAAVGAQEAAPVSRELAVPGNPILADGDYYSTDPAPLVADGQLWILTGRDEAASDVNDFIMPEWQLLKTADPASGKWTHYPAIIKPENVFAWAEKARAYAGQIVEGPRAADGRKRYYLYAPVLERDSNAEDKFAIGVAVADSPLGPWRDAHPAGPIISQKVPYPNKIQNIDPTVIVDDDQRVYIYWGTFGQLRGMELARDMITPKGPEQTVTGLTGFFEAPWIMKRKGTYYMLYAGNNAGPKSDCTQAVYYACIAYGSAPSPMGPWTYRGVMLHPVSSTTSHPGAVEFKGQWYLAYHTADAKGGGHFRRSVALDRMEWDDSVVPARIRTVVPTLRPQPPLPPSRNIARAAWATASNDPVPVQFWIKALNNGAVKEAPLPPDMWGSWSPNNPPRQWIEYRWDKPVTIDGSRLWFWNDQPAGSGVGVAPPASWHLEYWNSTGKRGWKTVPRASAYGTTPGAFQDVSFPAITTRCLRAVMDASTDGKTHAALAVQEWEVLAPKPQPIAVRSDNSPLDSCS